MAQTAQDNKKTLEVPYGIHRAHIAGYMLTESQKGSPQVQVKFTFQVDGKPRSWSWFGGLASEAMQEFTLKTLKMLGFQGTTLDDLAQLEDGPEGGALDMEREYEISIKTNNNGYPVVYVNDSTGGGGGAKRLRWSELAKKLKGEDSSQSGEKKSQVTDPDDLPF